MAARPRRALGTLFLLLAFFFAGIAVTAFASDFSIVVWGVGAAAGALAIWLATMGLGGLRRRAG